MSSRLLIAVTVAALAQLAAAESLKATLDAGNRKADGLLLARDVKGFAKYMKGEVTPTFVYVEAGKSMNLEQMCKGVAMGVGSMQKVTVAASKILTLKNFGKKAISSTQRTMEGITVGADKKPHKLTFTGTTEDTYVLTGGKWKMARMAWSAQKMLLDGKPMGATPNTAAPAR